MTAFICGIFAGVPAGILIHAWCVDAARRDEAMVAEVYRRRLADVLAAQNRLRGHGLTHVPRERPELRN